MTKLKKIGIVCLCFIGIFSVSACGGNETDHGDPNANRRVPSDSVTLTIGRESNGNELINFGAELDPYFTVSGYNLGRSGVSDNGSAWTVEEKDWAIVKRRLQDMNLKRIRMQMMPGWYAPTEESYKNKTYTYDSVFMKGVYNVLDTAKEFGMEVNITIWGTDGRARWLLEKDSPATTWLGMIADDRWDDFGGVSADVVKYLIEEKGYTNISEVTLYNEPTQDFSRLGKIKGFDRYASICRAFDAALKKVGIRDKIKLTLSDDTQDASWLSKTLSGLEGVYDQVSSHTYAFGPEYDNDTVQNTLNSYALKNFRAAMDGYENVPHIWNEFGLGGPSFAGTDTHTVPFADSPKRGFEIARVALNLLYAGSSGANYWVLFNQYYDETDRIMNMGLWRYADEEYACNPVYYAFSLLTRFTQKGAQIFPVETTDPHIMAVALKLPGGGWTYLVTNDALESKKVSFLNNTKFPQKMARYVYDENSVPTDGKVIPSSGITNADGRVLTTELAGRTFTVLSTIGF